MHALPRALDERERRVNGYEGYPELRVAGLFSIPHGMPACEPVTNHLTCLLPCACLV